MADFPIEYVERLAKLETKLDVIHTDMVEVKKMLSTKINAHDIELESTKIKMRYLIGTVVALSTAVGYSPLTQLLK